MLGRNLCSVFIEYVCVLFTFHCNLINCGIHLICLHKLKHYINVIIMYVYTSIGSTYELDFLH
jgi:hypothetical protein